MSKSCSHGDLPLYSLQSSHLNSCYYHQDLHNVLFDRALRHGYVTAHLPSYTLMPMMVHQRFGIDHPLQRHPFSGPVHSAGELLHIP